MATAAWVNIGELKGHGVGTGRFDFMLRYRAPFGVVAITTGFVFESEDEAMRAAEQEAERLNLVIGPEPSPGPEPAVSLTDILEGRA